MAEIRAFRGIRYSARDGASLAAVLAPPYDVINSDQQHNLCDSDPYNVVRLILDKECPGDNNTNNRYTRAANRFNSWQEKGVLVRDKQPALYLYEQEYTLPGGEHRTRRGIIGAVRLVDFSQGIILPHEQTFSKHKEDRLRLMQACGANLSPVFGLYSEPEGRIAEIFNRVTADKPLAVAALDTEEHRLWALTDPDMQAVVISAMADKQLFIADGHHRYETALNYSREQRRLRGLGEDGKYDFDYVMMVMVEMSDPGLTILPTHRLVINGKLPSRERLERFFEIRPVCRCCHDTALSSLAEAEESGHSLVREIEMLLIHGTLHLLGYDDQTACDRKVMMKKQAAIISRLAVDTDGLDKPQAEIRTEQEQGPAGRVTTASRCSKEKGRHKKEKSRDAQQETS
jgi:uncharacterized protein (DUF1015 family)